MSINFMKVHQPNMPHPDFIHKSLSKSKYADSLVENDTRIGRVIDKVRALGLDKGNTLVFWTTDNGAWQDVYPRRGYTVPRHQGHRARGGNRVPALAWMPGRVKAGSRNFDIVGGLDLMATFANLAGVKLPEKDREGQPIIFDSTTYRQSSLVPASARTSWFYFTENELSPGAARVGNYKAVFNLRGDDGAATGGLAVDTNLGWKGAEKYVATVPQVFDIWQDPQERYDIFMNNFTERTWTLVTISEAIKELMKTCVQYPRNQSEALLGPLTLSNYEKFQHVREILKKASRSACPRELDSSYRRPWGQALGRLSFRLRPPAMRMNMKRRIASLSMTVLIGLVCCRLLPMPRTRCPPGTTARPSRPSSHSSRKSQGRLIGLRAARRTHRHFRQRRHVVGRAADVFPASSSRSTA